MNSLRNRYTLLGVTMGSIVLFLVLLTHFLLGDRQQQTSFNIENQQRFIAHSHTIRHNVWQVQQVLNYHWTGNNDPDIFSQLNQSVTQASHIAQLLLNEPNLNSEQTKLLSHLVTHLSGLDQVRQQLLSQQQTAAVVDLAQLQKYTDGLIEEIWYQLLTLDTSLKLVTDNNISTLSWLSQQQGYFIWSISLLGLFSIGLIIFSLNQYTFKPLSLITHAILKEANGEDAQLIPDLRFSETKNLLTAFKEIKNQVHYQRDMLEHQASHDTLTGLANRSLLYDKLTQTITASKNNNSEILVILMDLNHFKQINDTLGHQVGDQLLIAVGMRLRYTLHDTDIIARLGGDEFAILVSDQEKIDAPKVCQKILNAFDKTFDVYGHKLSVGVSIGVTIYPQHGDDAETLLKRADVAMYAAKRNHLGFSIYEAENDANDDRYLSIANDLRLALRNDKLSVHYQLKYDLNHDEAVGAEALLRWFHPELGTIPPTQFVPIAEQLGIINELTIWILKQALAQCAKWRSEGVYLSIAVNISVYDLQSSSFVPTVVELLEEYDIPPCYLVIEVTESAMLIDPTHAINRLSELDKMGVRIAIDDFGTGFSSLGYLKKLPVDELKIDKSFVMDMIHDENDAVIVRSTIDLAHNLGLQVVAEGVEDIESYNLLKILRCNTAQGFYMCKPLPAQEIVNYLQLNLFQPKLSSAS